MHNFNAENNQADSVYEANENNKSEKDWVKKGRECEDV